MLRFALCGALIALLSACGGLEPSRRSVAATPTGTDAATGRPAIAPSALGPGGINRNYNIGDDPNFPGSRDGGRSSR